MQVNKLIRLCDCRRIRELNENNMKRYIDERRRQQLAQTRQSDALRRSHQEQFDKLNHEMDRVSILSFTFCFISPNMPSTNECFIQIISLCYSS